MAKLTKNSKLLIAILVIQSIIELFSNTFLAAYFFNLTNNNVVPLSLFNIIIFLTIIFGSFLVGALVKKGHRLWVFRVGFVANALLLILIFLLRDRIISYVWTLGIILGISQALFWLPSNVLESQIVTKDQLIKFDGYSLSMEYIFDIIMPIILGWFIQVDSFANVAIFILILTLAQFVLSYFFRKMSAPRKPFQFKRICLLTLKSREIRSILGIEFLEGIVFSSINLLIILYVLYMFKTNLNLGIFVSAFAVLEVLGHYFFGKYFRYKDFKWLLIICVLAIIGASSYFVFDTTKLSFIIFNFVFTIVLFSRRISRINMFRISQRKPIVPNYRTEYLVLREMVLDMGGVVGFDIIILVALSGSQALLKYLILAFSVLITFIAYINIKLNNRINLHKKQIIAPKI